MTSSRFTISSVMLATTTAASAFALCRLVPAFTFTWLFLGVWVVLLFPARPNVRRLQFVCLVLAMAWRLDFGRRLFRFSSHWFAEEGAVFAVIGSVLILLFDGMRSWLYSKPT
ncbi:hypothetical protein Q31b_50210 [Novipirellula aureliae]|uniref:Uncharacterized protein n=1 Tax=Novipirellula aureliae TaxID=2527966 RepID=A0A5C6DPK5_9BACT|nr:hypothetical protein Q31b_50210 [Novipirellula aureliae]